MPDSTNSSDLTAEQLVSVLKRSGLVDDRSLTGALNDYRQQNGPDDANALAEFLVNQNLITSWQAAKLLKGKHRGFYLGKYKLLTLLGRGGMSSVYLAEHIKMKRRCALKVLPHKFVNDSSYLERFHREAQAVAALDHPNIVRAYDIDSERDGQLEIHFLVMECIEGNNFYELVKALGPLDVHTAADYIRQAALGLQHAHDAGLVHRDIKPGNFIVDMQGTVKMMDLGLAKAFTTPEEFSLTMVNDERILGTADYLAPEQAVDSHHVDTRADIYALGCTFYFLLTGEPPHGDGTLTQRLLAHQTKTPKGVRALRPSVPGSLESLIERMMKKDRDERIQTAAEVAKKLERWLETNEGDSSDDSVTQLPAPNIKALLSGPPSGIADDSNELMDFLSRLDSKTTHDDPTVRGPESASEKASESPADANLHFTTDSKQIKSQSTAGSQSSRLNSSKRIQAARQLQFTIQLWVLGAILVVALAIFLLTRDKEPPVPKPVVETTPGAQKNHVTPPVEPDRNLTGPVISVGPDGDFRTLSAALDYVLLAGRSSQFNEIRIASGQTIDDQVEIDNSGLGQFPKGFLIHGEGPDFPILAGSGETLLTLNSVEGLTLSDLVFDASECQQAVLIRGYATGTTFTNLQFRDIRRRAITGAGVRGLQHHQIRIQNCDFYGTESAKEGICFDVEQDRAFGVSGTRQIAIRQCRFLGPLENAIRFSEVTIDVSIEESIFHDLKNGIVFDGGDRQEVSRMTFANNTFHQNEIGINFLTGPIEAASAITFRRNLFVDISQGEVLTDRAGVSLATLSENAEPPRQNWTTGSPQARGTWLNVFTNDGRFQVPEIQFVSLDRESEDFLRPTSRDFIPAEQSNGPGNFIGAVRP